MSLTRNGNRTGRAASIELREQREYIREQYNDTLSKFLLDYGDALVMLKALDPKFDSWYDGRPEQTTGTMYPVMLARIEELKRQVEPIASAIAIREGWDREREEAILQRDHNEEVSFARQGY
jgi:hypothetical protein